MIFLIDNEKQRSSKKTNNLIYADFASGKISRNVAEGDNRQIRIR